MGFNVTAIDGVVKVEITKKGDLTYSQLREEIGVRFLKGQSSPVGERVRRLDGIMTVGEATGLIFNIGTNDGVSVVNSFDHLPVFGARNVLHNGNFFREFDKGYYKYEELKEGENIWEYYWTSLTKHEGYFTPHNFIGNDGIEKDTIMIGRYKAFRDGDNKLRSIPGVIPTVSTTGANYLTYARNNDGLGVDSQYLIGDIWEKSWFNFRQIIRMATKNVQSVLLGATSLSYTTTHETIGEQTDSNSFVLPSSQASAYVLGQTISGGDSQGSNSVFAYRVITNIENDFPNSDETTITFDGEQVSTIPAGTIIGSRAWTTGTTDSILATDGYFEENNGKYSCKIDGIENPFGDIYENVAGVKVNDHKVYVSKDTSKYNWNANTIDYHELSYELPKDSGYAKEMGFDPNFPMANMTKEVGGGSSTYFSDYFYQNSGWRTVFVGGYWYSTSRAGLWGWYAASGLGAGSIYIGARLSYRP